MCLPDFKRTSCLSYQKGFTLLELMIVIAMMALITGLFVDPISRVYDLRIRLKNHIDGVHLSLLTKNWFHSTLSGLYMTKTKFSGDKQKLTGITYAPLDDDLGLPTKFEWRLTYDKGADLTQLEYVGWNDQVIVIAEWPGESGQFSYYDSENEKWESEWQNSDLVQEEEYKLPLFVRIDGKWDNKPWIITATIDPTRGYLKDKTQELKKMIEQMKEKMRQQEEMKKQEQEEGKDRKASPVKEEKDEE